MWHLPSFTLPHFADHIPTLHAASSLPTPTELFAIGGALIVGAVLVLLFLKAAKMAVYMGIVGIFVLFCAGLALGYVDQGENNILPQVISLTKQRDAANEEAASFKAKAFAAQAAATQAFKTRNAMILATAKALGDQIDAQAETIRNLRVDAAAGRLLGPAIDAANADRTAESGTGSPAAAAPAVAYGDTNLAAVEHWASQAIAVYSQCANQVRGLQKYINQVVTDSAHSGQAAQ